MKQITTWLWFGFACTSQRSAGGRRYPRRFVEQGLPEADIHHPNADKELQAVSWKKGGPTAEGNTKPPFEKPEWRNVQRTSTLASLLLADVSSSIGNVQDALMH